MKHVFSLSLLVTFIFLMTLDTLAQEMVPFVNHEGKELTARLNEKTGSADRIYGIRDHIEYYNFNRASLDSTSVSEIGPQLFNAYSEQLRINDIDVQIRKVDTDGSWWFVNYKQMVGNIPVKSSEIGFTINPDGYIMALGAKVYPEIRDISPPRLNEDEALRVALRIFDEENTEIISQPSLMVLPLFEQSDYSFFLTYEMTLRSLQPIRNTTYFVDAHTGRVLREVNNIRANDIYGTVMGGYWADNAGDAPISNGLTSRIVVSNSMGQTVTNVISNPNGSYSTGNLSYQFYYITYSLANSWIQIRDNGNSGAPVTHTTAGFIGQHNYNWTASDGSNVHWHATQMHDFFNGAPLNYSGMNYQMRAYINDGASTNGAADGTYIYFGSSGNHPWARSRDVVTHEYTHNVINSIYDGWIDPSNDYFSEGYAMDEGIADYFAATTIGRPNVAADVGINRTLNNNFTWDEDNGAHWNGQVIGGALWRTRQAVGTTMANNLAFKALQLVPRARTFEDYLYNVYLVDNSEYNGSNQSYIETSFEQHGITSLYPPLPPPAPQTPLLAGTVSSGAPSLSWNASTGATTYWLNRFSTHPQVSTETIITTNTSYIDQLPIDVEVAQEFFGNISYTVQAVNYQNIASLPSNAIVYSQDASGGVGGMSKQLSDSSNENEELQRSLPEQYVVHNSYPNPFNPRTVIGYDLPVDSSVRVIVYDVMGRLVKVLVDSNVSAGNHQVTFDATDLNSGMYLAVFEAYGTDGQRFSSTTSMTLVK
ncbi:MAG: T9SS type A sorting domain-containing protein [Balneolales bacterium]|nr:T9SS type A sorting domain-containing protein [Balneolales bacterium]